MKAGELAREKSAERHDPFAVYGAGELRFALNVDDALGADEGPRGDSGRAAEGVVADLVDGEAVDLSDDLVVKTHHQGAFADLVLNPFFRQVGTVALMRDRRFDVRPGHERMSVFPGPVPGLADEVADQTEAE